MRKTSSRVSLLISAILIASCGGGGGGGVPGIPDLGPNGPQGASKVYVSGTVNGSVAQIASYTDASFTTGALAAARVISGPDTKLDALANGPGGIAGDAIGDRLFAVNKDDNSILVFDGVSQASGNVAPSRTIVGANTLLDTPVFLFLDVANDRLYVSNSGLSRTVLVFDNASTVSGNVAPTRVIAGFTQIFSTLSGIQVDALLNILYVADLSAGAIYVLDNADAVNGLGVIASRVITGVNTTLLGPRGMALDTADDRLYVTSPNQIGSGAILVFDAASTLNGNIAPNRTITTTDVVFQPASLYLDRFRNRIYFSNPGLDTLEYINNASSVNGTVAPTAVATLTGVLDPFGVFVDTR